MHSNRSRCDWQELPRNPIASKWRTARITALFSVAAILLYPGSNSPSISSFYAHALVQNATVGTHSLAPCGTGIDCGSVVVPLDYLNRDGGDTATIAIARQNATKLPRKGTIFINPGGPGGSGVNVITSSGELLSHLLGPEWDIIGFDPRGVGQTIPAVQCFPSFLAWQFFRANTVLEQAITIDSISNVSSPAIREELVRQYQSLLSLDQGQAEMCKKNMGDTLKYMGSTTVVRDIDFMTQIFDGPDAPINYWGISYGTVIGNFLVNMLPDRVGYVTIDGVVDPVLLTSSSPYFYPHNWLGFTEETYEHFLSDCASAGPSSCPLASETNEDWHKIEQQLEDFFDKLALSPLAVPFGYRPGSLTSGAARGLLLESLYSPSTWPSTSQVFSEAIAGNGTALFDILVPNFDPKDPWTDLIVPAVTCLDAPPPESAKDFPTAEDLAEQGLKTLRETSIHFGVGTLVPEPNSGCQYWPVRGPERFSGPFNAQLKRPILIVGNKVDPITPLTSALEVNELMPNSSVLVIHSGPGHTSVSLPSLCTAKLIRGYFSGETPRNGTMCQADTDTFPDPATDEARLEKLSPSDRELLLALRNLAKNL